MADSKRQLSPLEAERERFSNFVVDLRRRETTAARTLPAASRAGSETIRERLSRTAAGLRNFWRRAARRPRSLRPDFKEAAPAPAARRRTRIFRLRSPRHPWSAFIKEKEDIFRSRVDHIARNGRVRRRRDRRPAVGIFILILLLIILLFQLSLLWPFGRLADFAARITGRSQLAVGNLLAGAGAASQDNLKDAGSDFQAAAANFLAAQADLSRVNDAILSLAALSGDPRLQLASESRKFLLAGAAASSLGQDLVLATDSLFHGNQDDFAGSLDNFLTHGQQAVADAMSLKQALAAVNPAHLPAAYRSKFSDLSDQAGQLADDLSGLVTTGQELKEVLGLSRDKRYLVVFQNNAELRASGGFLGSYALVDLSGGKIRDLEVPGGGSYDTAAGLKVRVAAPQPLWLVGTLWHFWDANWWPDWPTTAQNLMWFYDKSGGPSVDGVISVTPTVIEDLLTVTGPIDLTQEYGLTIDADNFWDTVQSVTEEPSLAKTYPAAVAGLPTSSPAVQTTLPLEQGLSANPANKPKKIIGDLLVKILAVLPQKLTPDNLVKIMKIFSDNLAGKQILLYFKDPALEAAVSDRNWGGVVQAADQDYLMVVDTNIAGQKTDRVISEQIGHLSEVAPDGSIINTIQVVRTHNGVKGTPLTGVRNVDWLRVYVPAGSQLLSAAGWRAPDASYLQDRPDATMSASPLLAAENAAAADPVSGTKIYPEDGKTVFADWLMLDPGETATVTLEYRLPFNFFTPLRTDSWLQRLNRLLNPSAGALWPYSLLVQKQPGAAAAAFTSRLILPDAWSVFWRYPSALAGSSGWDISTPLSRDQYWSILVAKTKPD